MILIIISIVTHKSTATPSMPVHNLGVFGKPSTTPSKSKFIYYLLFIIIWMF